MKQGKARKRKPTYCGKTRTAKIRYRTLKDAKGPRSALELSVGKPVRIYLCHACKGYHLTTREQFEWGNSHTVWKTPDRSVSSENEPDDTEEIQNGQDD